MTSPDDFLLSQYQYELPESQIAQTPPETRGTSRLLVMNKDGELGLEHHIFTELPQLLPKGALLVANNSRVLPARLTSFRASGGKIEFLLLTPLPTVFAQAHAEGDVFCAPVSGLMKAGGKIKDGEVVHFGENIWVRVLKTREFGMRDLELFWKGNLVEDYKQEGKVPLPPYIRRDARTEDLDRYQTVYSSEEKIGSVAAPTAGLHFTKALNEELLEKGFLWKEVTLYVGYGTFSPVREEDIRTHAMHSELVEVPEETVQAIAQAKREGRPVIAIGTTSVRSLEGAAEACGGELAAWTGYTDIFLYPGKEFRVIDGLVTNFHLPGSSLVMLVAALCGRKRILDAYAEAVRQGYRFFSYGDAMFIRP